MSVVAYALANQLAGNANVQSFVVANGITRIFPNYVKLSDKVFPLCYYKIENIVAEMSHSGPTGFETADFIVAAETTEGVGGYKRVSQLALAIQTALNGLSGTWDGVVVQGVFLRDDGIQDYTYSDPTTESILYFGKELSFKVCYSNQ